jgi:hypothetical protein
MVVNHCGIETGNYFLFGHGFFFPLDFVFAGSGGVSHVSWWNNTFQFFLFICIFLGVEMDFKDCGERLTELNGIFIFAFNFIFSSSNCSFMDLACIYFCLSTFCHHPVLIVIYLCQYCPGSNGIQLRSMKDHYEEFIFEVFSAVRCDTSSCGDLLCIIVNVE